MSAEAGLEILRLAWAPGRPFPRPPALDWRFLGVTGSVVLYGRPTRAVPTELVQAVTQQHE